MAAETLWYGIHLEIFHYTDETRAHLSHNFDRVANNWNIERQTIHGAVILKGQLRTSVKWNLASKFKLSRQWMWSCGSFARLYLLLWVTSLQSWALTLFMGASIFKFAKAMKLSWWRTSTLLKPAFSWRHLENTYWFLDKSPVDYMLYFNGFDG